MSMLGFAPLKTIPLFIFIVRIGKGTKTVPKGKKSVKPISKEDIQRIQYEHDFGSIKALRRYLANEGYSTKGIQSAWEEFKPPPDIPYNYLSKQRVKYSSPIYSSRPGGWQFDIVVPSRAKKKAGEPYQLFFVNNNTKEIKSYPMSNKDSEDVMPRLKQFFESEEKSGRKISALTSDEDKAFLSESVLKYLASKGVDYHTTKRENHHNLGVLNRAIHTIRKKGNINELRNYERNHSISNDRWQKYIRAYNNEVHSATGMKPNDMAEDREAEIDFINNKMNESDEHRKKSLENISEGEYVRLFNDPNFVKHDKNQRTLDPFTYRIKEVEPNGTTWVVGKDDNKVKQVPRYLISTDQRLVQPHYLAPDIEMPEYDIDSILGFNNGKYKVKYSDGDVGDLTWRQLRNTQPLKETPLEKEYWDTHQMENTKKRHMKTRKSTRLQTENYRGTAINSLIKKRHEGEEDIWKYYDAD